ncbi:MAG TPA: DNA replication/repair protein RecF [Salinisphaeraceae bacterium]|nr:DNA replication/repair protein RecF [Salinisphaeraceae bacterium]
MRITNLQAVDFRCFHHFSIRPTAGINLLLGDNGSGKTSALEAIHLLARGQSFRGSRVTQIMRHGSKQFVLRAQSAATLHERLHRVGMIGEDNKLRYKLDGDAGTPRHELVKATPLQLIEPNLHRLFEQGPRFRRRFLDWGVFHVEPSFYPAWRQYRRALRQRNRALRNKADIATISAWDFDLIRAARIIDQSRRKYIDKLAAALPQTLSRLIGEEAPSMHYVSGWSHRASFTEALAAAMEGDRKAGYTRQGPHRADLRIEVAEVEAKAHVSRGQQKLLGIALLLTQAYILMDAGGEPPIVLVDDLQAELGRRFQQAVMQELAALDCQCFITAIEPSTAWALPAIGGMFHVEHAGIKAVQ